MIQRQNLVQVRHVIRSMTAGPPREKSSDALRVAVIDGDPTFRESLGETLGRPPLHGRARLFASPDEALAGLAAEPADVALIDAQGWPDSGVDCFTALRSARSATLLIALTAADDAGTVAQVIASGAHGYLVKTGRMEDVVEALVRVRHGEPALSPVVVRHILTNFRRFQPAPEQRFGLSLAEWRVLEETVAGHDCKTIARRLHLALGTVYVHNRRILRKLQVHSRLAAVARYRELMQRES